MDTNTKIILIVILSNLVLGTILFLYFNGIVKQKKIEKVKKSLLSVEINRVMDEWKNKIKIIPMADGRIKIDFPEPIVDRDIFFYLSQDDDKITISDHGEIIAKMDMNKTPNKHAIKKLSGMLGVTYSPHSKCIYLDSTLDQLDEDMWTMVFAIILLEYVTY